jgi:hypothetical protein
MRPFLCVHGWTGSDEITDTVFVALYPGGAYTGGCLHYRRESSRFDQSGVLISFTCEFLL